MRRRVLQIVGVSGVMLAVILLLKFAVADQTSRPTVLKTPWGEPNLQGIWTDEYQTPLQRPAKYAGKEFFTDEERAALDARRAAI